MLLYSKQFAMVHSRQRYGWLIALVIYDMRLLRQTNRSLSSAAAAAATWW